MIWSLRGNLFYHSRRQTANTLAHHRHFTSNDLSTVSFRRHTSIFAMYLLQHLLLVLEKFLFEANYDHCMSEFKITHLNVNQAFSHHGIRAASTNFHLNSLFNERSTNMCCACVRCYVKGRQPRRSTQYIYTQHEPKNVVVLSLTTIHIYTGYNNNIIYCVDHICIIYACV